VSGFLGVDVGGTFTDLVLWDGTYLTTGKVPTTPRQEEGVLEGSQALAAADVEALVHGTTAATNALLERKGARTALITTRGFEDVIEIGRQDRPSLYDSMSDRPQPLVPPDLRFGDDVDPSEVSHLAEAVAVCLLNSFADPSMEVELERRLREAVPDVAVSRSSAVVPEFREYERTSTTVLNAYLTPVVAGYLEALVEKVVSGGVARRVEVMRSSGGLLPASEAAELVAALLLSGPAGGVVAASALGEALGHDRLIAFDMGGTSTDVCRIEGGVPEVSFERSIEGYPCRMPSVAVHTVGAGGGSLGWVDSGGSLRVGPESAGALPGPACYGHGGTGAAVTDAHLALGRIDAAAAFGGLKLQPGAAEAVLASLGGRIDHGVHGVAAGMLTVVEEVMAGAIRKVSLEEGADPRQAILVAFGGAGGLHATNLARSLDMAGVVIPPHAGVFSALGLLLSPPRVDEALTVLAATIPELTPALNDVCDRARARLDGALETSVDVRYVGQSHEISVAYRSGESWDVLAQRFHRAHRERNGFARESDPIEAVTVRARIASDPALRWSQLPEHRAVGTGGAGSRDVFTDGEWRSAGVFWRPGLAAGAEVIGPAVIEEPEATTVLGPGERAIVHPTGALEVEW
jgi:N-methylhydantoinase A